MDVDMHAALVDDPARLRGILGGVYGIAGH